jgi:hypothetical protein
LLETGRAHYFCPIGFTYRVSIVEIKPDLKYRKEWPCE